jgi:hypothetical protein
MVSEGDDLLDLLEALGKVLLRVIVAMRLGVPRQNVAMETPQRRGIAHSELVPGVQPQAGLRSGGHHAHAAPAALAKTRTRLPSGILFTLAPSYLNALDRRDR